MAPTNTLQAKNSPLYTVKAVRAILGHKVNPLTNFGRSESVVRPRLAFEGGTTGGPGDPAGRRLSESLSTLANGPYGAQHRLGFCD